MGMAGREQPIRTSLDAIAGDLLVDILRGHVQLLRRAAGLLHHLGYLLDLEGDPLFAQGKG